MVAVEDHDARLALLLTGAPVITASFRDALVLADRCDPTASWWERDYMIKKVTLLGAHALALQRHAALGARVRHRGALHGSPAAHGEIGFFVRDFGIVLLDATRGMPMSTYGRLPAL